MIFREAGIYLIFLSILTQCSQAFLSPSPKVSFPRKLFAPLSLSKKSSSVLGEDVIKSIVAEVRLDKNGDFGNSLENSPALVLNADYTPLSHTPLSLWHWQDALRSVFSNKAVVVSEYNVLIRSVSCSFKIPSVIALKNYHKKPNNVPIMTRKYLFIRDGFRCQV